MKIKKWKEKKGTLVSGILATLFIVLISSFYYNTKELKPSYLWTEGDFVSKMEFATKVDTGADNALRRDWLFQSGGASFGERGLAEIQRARKLANRLLQNTKQPDLSAELTKLTRLEQQFQTEKNAGEELYLAVREVKRRIIFSNPAIDFTALLFIDQPYPRHPNGPPWPIKTRGNLAIHEAYHRSSITATPGGKLVVLHGLQSNSARTNIGPATEGSYWRPELSFDATKVLFCYKPATEDAFHIYESDLNGRNPRQLTSGNYDDLDPIYLPDGHLMFVSTRCNTYARCIPNASSFVLTRCDADGNNIYIVSLGNEYEYLPVLLEDGRVAYSRWEYTDKALWRIQSLWTVNPDGTGASVLWGNQSVWPDHLAQPRGIPGTARVMFTGVGHHNWFGGSIGIIDPELGREFPDGLAKVTSDIPWPEVGNGPVDPVESKDYVSPGAYDAFQTPFPISGRDFLVSARRKGDNKFRLYLMDLDGNCEFIAEGANNIWHAIPVRPRQKPPTIPDMVKWPGTGNQRQAVEGGTFYSTDIYEGVPELPRGMVKSLRVWQQIYSTFSEGSQAFRWAGPGVSGVQEDAAKRILGTVPVHVDGSVHFKVPAGKMLYFQLLDKHGRALQTMRSFTGVMPGEIRGCVGCHEQRLEAPPSRSAVALQSKPAEALQSKPDELTPPTWGDETIGYERFVQPVLDRYCGKCHQGSGKARATLDLTLRPAYDFLKEPYITLLGAAIWIEPTVADMPHPAPTAPGYGLAGIYPVESYLPDETLKPITFHNTTTQMRTEALVAKYATLPPMTTLSYRSPLIALAMNGKHHGVKVDPVSLQRLIAWVDAFGPYRGLEEIKAMPDPDFPGIDRLSVRPLLKSAPDIVRP